MALTDDAMNGIKDMILRGALKPGDRLPPEKELGERLGLSRNSLREAVKALEVIRVLDVRRGDGTYVTRLDTSELGEAISFIVDLHQNSAILDLLEVRRILEGAAAASAAGKITDAQLGQLEQEIEAVEAESIDSLVEHDMAFHAIIAEAAGNSYLSSLLEGLSSHTARARVWRGLTDGNAVQRTIDEHRAIVQALRQRDADMARAVVMVHIGGVEKWLKMALQAADDADAKVPRDQVPGGA